MFVLLLSPRGLAIISVPPSLPPSMRVIDRSQLSDGQHPIRAYKRLDVGSYEEVYEDARAAS